MDETFVPAKKKTLSVSTPNSAATPVWEGDVSMFKINRELAHFFYFIKVCFCV